jgi:hypothetical protein
LFDRPVPDADAYFAELRSGTPGLLILEGRARWLLVDYGVRVGQFVLLAALIARGEIWAIVAIVAAIVFGLVRWLALSRRSLTASLIEFGVEAVLVVAVASVFLTGTTAI